MRMPRVHLTLQAKLLLLVSGTATGMAVVVVLAFTALVLPEIGRAVRADVRAAGGVFGQSVQRQNAVLLDQCRLLADQPALRAIISTHDPATIADSARDYRTQIGADAALVTDRAGCVAAATDAPADSGRDISRTPGIAAALGGHSWTGIVPRDGRLMMAVTVPILIHGETWGTWTAFRAIDPGLAGQLHDALGSDVAFLYQGRVMGASLPVPPRLPMPDSPKVITLRGRRYFALYAALPGTDPKAAMGCLTLRPYDSAMALYNRCLIAFVTVSGLTLLLALTAGAVVAGSLTRPLHGVVLAAQTLQAGGWPERFIIKRHDELGLLQAVFNDMTTAMKGHQEHLLTLADSDPLTGLLNHRTFHKRLEEEADRAHRQGHPIAVAILDLDNFKFFNDVYGHIVGDEVLRQVAAALRAGCRSYDTLARYGGDEFALIMPGVEAPEATGLIQRLVKNLEDAGHRPAGSETVIPLVASFGIAVFPEDAPTRMDVMELADARLRRSKTGGGDGDPTEILKAHLGASWEGFTMLNALVAAVDNKDRYTRRHSEDVMAYSGQIAQELGLDEDTQRGIMVAALLHDVGKVGVPDHILRKPSRLTGDEFEAIKQHPVMGAVIVAAVPGLEGTLEAIKHHHEAWNGGGYPSGLRGESIPLVARLMAVADAYSAMTTDRPYRKGMPAQTALDMLEAGAGEQWDPQCVRAFLRVRRAMPAADKRERSSGIVT